MSTPVHTVDREDVDHDMYSTEKSPGTQNKDTFGVLTVFNPRNQDIQGECTKLATLVNLPILLPFSFTLSRKLRFQKSAFRSKVKAEWTVGTLNIF